MEIKKEDYIDLKIEALFGKLFYKLIHKIKQPLNSIYLEAQLINRVLKKMKKSYDKINLYSDNILETIDNINLEFEVFKSFLLRDLENISLKKIIKKSFDLVVLLNEKENFFLKNNIDLENSFSFNKKELFFNSLMIFENLVFIKEDLNIVVSNKLNTLEFEIDNNKGINELENNFSKFDDIRIISNINNFSISIDLNNI